MIQSGIRDGQGHLRSRRIQCWEPWPFKRARCGWEPYPQPGRGREPSVLCKIVTAVDVISKGRGALALGSRRGGRGGDRSRSGWRSNWPSAAPCLTTITLATRGRFHTIDGAVNRPRPVQSGGVPIVVRSEAGHHRYFGRGGDSSGGGPHADAVMWTGDPDVVAEYVDHLAPPGHPLADSTVLAASANSRHLGGCGSDGRRQCAC